MIFHQQTSWEFFFALFLYATLLGMAFMWYNRPACHQLPTFTWLSLGFHGTMILCAQAWAIFPFGITLFIHMLTKSHRRWAGTYFVWRFPSSGPIKDSYED